jgi:hypothetical protein
MLETAASLAVLGLFVAYLGSLPSIAPQQSAAARFAWMGEGDTEYYEPSGYDSYYAEPEGGYYSSEPTWTPSNSEPSDAFWNVNQEPQVDRSDSFWNANQEPQGEGYGIGGDTSFEPAWTPTSEPSDAFWNVNQEPQGAYGDMGQWYTGTEYDNNSKLIRILKKQKRKI